MSSIPVRTADGGINVIVETPEGSTAKFKFDPQLGVTMLSRPLPMGIAYPYDWGFILSTRASDGDPPAPRVTSCFT